MKQQAGERMRVEICVEQRALRRWHVTLMERLALLAGIEVGVRWAEPANEPLPTCVDVLFTLERLVHGIPAGPSSSAEPSDLSRHVGRGGLHPDLVIDLSGQVPADGAARWRLLFDARAGEGSAVGAILAERTPLVAIEDVATGQPVASGRPGTERPDIAVASLDDILARTTTLILAAVEGAGQAATDQDPAPAAADAACSAAAQFGMRGLARAALVRISGLLRQNPHRRVGWRFVSGPDVFDLGRHPDEGWRTLPDDGSRFFADPFPVVVAGRPWLFVEDFDHSRGRGIVSAVPFDGTGPVGVPEPVLDSGAHLSYPFVLEHAGAIWMVPKSTTTGTVDLYRATRFPGGWVKEATLLAGLEASDATPFRHGGRWWMTATVRDGGSYSDALHLWSAPDLLGPWTAHAANPVLVDLSSARPAGRVVERNGRLIRPVQDRRGGAGVAVALAEITRLDDDAFEQNVFASIRPGPLWPGRRIHTLNRAGPLECIDGATTAPRLHRPWNVATEGRRVRPADLGRPALKPG